MMQILRPLPQMAQLSALRFDDCSSTHNVKILGVWRNQLALISHLVLSVLQSYSAQRRHGVPGGHFVVGPGLRGDEEARLAWCQTRAGRLLALGEVAEAEAATLEHVVPSLDVPVALGLLVAHGDPGLFPRLVPRRPVSVQQPAQLASHLELLLAQHRPRCLLSNGRGLALDRRDNLWGEGRIPKRSVNETCARPDFRCGSRKVTKSPEKYRKVQIVICKKVPKHPEKY